MKFDEEYWFDSETEEVNVRQKAREVGIPKEKVDEMIRKHPDAFEIGKDEWGEMMGEE